MKKITFLVLASFFCMISFTQLKAQTKEQVKDQFRDSFVRADTDGTGQLTKDQVASMMSSPEAPPNPQHITRIFNFMDEDRSGTVDLDEFANAMMVMEEQSSGFTIIRMRFMFNRYDVDNSGVITADNLVALAKSDPSFDLDDSTMKAFMDKCDSNGNGEIDFKEFAEAMSN